jgi:hypothetical protein
MSTWPPLPFDSKAIRVPSGDQLGSTSTPREKVTCRRCRPLASTT